MLSLLIMAFYEWTRLRPSRRRLRNISTHLLLLSMPPAFFLSRVKGIADLETKHKIIGNTFIEVFQNKAKEIAAIAAGSPQAGDIELLLQGTLYPDTLRRGSRYRLQSTKDVDRYERYAERKDAEDFCIGRGILSYAQLRPASRRFWWLF
jgi:hypothetical protein